MTTPPLIPWSSADNYPSSGDDWSNTPTKVAPAYSSFTPNDPPAAQEMNSILNQRDAWIGAMAVGMWAGACANWNEPTANIGGTSIQNTPTGAWWDGFSSQWIVTCGVPSPFGQVATVMMSYDGVRWFSIAGGVPDPVARLPWAVATNPATGDLVILRSDGSTSSTTLWVGGTGSGTDTVQSFLDGCDQGVLTYWNGSFWFVGATGIASSTWSGHAASSASGAGAWTDATSGLPSGWTAGSTDTILEWLTAQTATTLVVAMCALTVGTGTSRLMSQTSASPGVWTDITPSVLGGSAKHIRGLCFSANDGLWGLLAVDASNAYLYTSPDLATWTLVQTFEGCAATGVAVIGSAWAVLTWNGVLGEGGNRIQVSTNVGSAQAQSTFFYGAYSEAVSGQATVPATNPAGLLLSSGQQLLRCEILRPQFGSKFGGMVASSQVSGFVGSVPVGSPSPQPFSPPTVRVNHASYPTTAPWAKAALIDLQFLVDAAGGTTGIDTGLVALQDGGHITVTNVNGDMGGSPCTVTDASGRTFEVAGSPLTFASSVSLNGKGASYRYVLDTIFNRWKLD